MYVIADMQVNPSALRVIRERSGLSQSDLARLIGKPQSYISNIEAGRRGVSEEMAKKIAEALKAPLLAIIGGVYDEVMEEAVNA